MNTASWEQIKSILRSLSKTLFGNITSVKEIAEGADGKADAAKTAASTAQSTADAAKTAASTAQSTADAAKTAASNAQTTANTAKSTADAAKTAASNAQTTANTAKSTADAAKTAASNAQTAADNAQSTASAAKSTADAAKTMTENAKREKYELIDTVTLEEPIHQLIRSQTSEGVAYKFKALIIKGTTCDVKEAAYNIYNDIEAIARKAPAGTALSSCKVASAFQGLTTSYFVVKFEKQNGLYSCDWSVSPDVDSSFSDVSNLRRSIRATSSALNDSTGNICELVLRRGYTSDAHIPAGTTIEIWGVWAD